MRKKWLKECMIAGMAACILTGCGNTIPELTEEEASLVATYAADAVLQFSKNNDSRLLDTEKEGARREELEKRVEEIREQMKEEEQEEEQEEAGQSGSMGSVGDSAVPAAGVESIASFIGLDGFEVSYGGYEIKESYAENEFDEWDPTIEATEGKNLLIVKLDVTNTKDTPAVADVLSKNVMFHISGEDMSGSTVNGTAMMTMLLNDFAYAQEEIEAGQNKEFVLMIQVDETVTEVNTLSLYMKKDGEGMTVKLQ